MNLLDKINDANRNKSPEEIPNLDELLTMIIDFLEYIDTPEMKEFEKNDKNGYTNHVDRKFSKFTLRYYGIFTMLMQRKNREENLYKIIELITQLKKVQLGESDLDKEYETFTKNLNKEYIYSQFGGQEQFEKTIKNRNK